MCAKVLQLVNSAFFGRAAGDRLAAGASHCLGTNMLKNLVLSVEVFRAFEATAGAGVLARGAPAPLRCSWARSPRASSRRGRQAEQRVPSARHAPRRGPAGAGGAAAPAQFARALARWPEARTRRLHARRAGGSARPHAEVGAYLLGLWGLPVPVVEAVAHHHAPATRVAPHRFDILAARPRRRRGWPTSTRNRARTCPSTRLPRGPGRWPSAPGMAAMRRQAV